MEGQHGDREHVLYFSANLQSKNMRIRVAEGSKMP